MLFKYSLFEFKILLRNRKQWILGLVLILFFPLFFQYYLDAEPTTLESQKRKEKELMLMALEIIPDDLRDTPEGKEIYDNLTKQLSIINFQIYYIATEPGQKEDNYVEDGIHLNELRLEMHEKGNPYIPDYFVIPKEEINKENAYYYYMDDHKLSPENNPFVTSQFLVTMIQLISGLLLYIYILLVGSDMLVYENRHQTVLRGLPISFITKATSKIGVHYIYIITCLAIGVGLGSYISSEKAGFGDFSYPILIYTSNGFEAISMMKYFGYVSLAILMIVCLVLSLALLMQIIFQHMYATILVGLGIFALPDLLQLVGIKANFLFPIKYIDFTAVLSGKIAEQFGKNYIDYWHSMTWMTVFTIVILGITVLQNRFTYYRKGRLNKG